MTEPRSGDLDRRDFLTRTVPACSLACLGVTHLLAMAGADEKKVAPGEPHKFDAEFEQTTTQRRRVSEQQRSLIGFIKTLQTQIDEKELIRLLELYSAEVGRQVGAQQARNAPDTSFPTFVKAFRPPNYANLLTHEIVEDTENAFQLRVTECVWASVYRDAGLGGEIGHAAVCNMDYHWPQAFNPSFRMERTKTLMQGHDHCNHRYIVKT